MMDGRGRRLMDFLDLAEGLHVKTLRRDLDGLSTVPELQIVTYDRDGHTWYRMDGKLKHTPEGRKHKPCNTCHKDLDIEEFARNRSSPDGRAWKCIKCTEAYNKDWYAKNKKTINAALRRKRKNPKLRDHINKLRRDNYARKKGRGVSAEPILQAGHAAADHRPIPFGSKVPSNGSRADEDWEDFEEDPGSSL